MKEISKILKTSNSAMPWNPNPIHTKAFEDVDELFSKIGEMLGHAAIGRFFGEAALGQVKVTWAQHMVGMSPAEVERGMNELATRKFIPTLGEFRNWCRPCLDPEYAWHEAGTCLRQRDSGDKGDWTHPAVWRAACTLSMEVRSGDYGKHRAQWAYELRRELAKGFGDGVPEPLKRLEAAPAVTKPPNEEIRAKLKALREGSRP